MDFFGLFVEKDADFGRQRLQGEGFLQDGGGVIDELRAPSGVIGIAGHEQHFNLGHLGCPRHLRPGLGQAASQLLSSDVWHYYVGKQQVNRMFVVVRNLERFITVRGLQHGIAIFLKKLADEITDFILIFHY
jgi:hypothetical protein